MTQADASLWFLGSPLLRTPCLLSEFLFFVLTSLSSAFSEWGPTSRPCLWVGRSANVSILPSFLNHVALRPKFLDEVTLCRSRSVVCWCPLLLMTGATGLTGLSDDLSLLLSLFFSLIFGSLSMMWIHALPQCSEVVRCQTRTPFLYIPSGTQINAVEPLRLH